MRQSSKANGSDSVPQYASVGATETFFTRNAKTITFLVCMALFLAFFGPFSVWRIAKEINRDRRPELTVADAILLSQAPDSVTMEKLRTYRGLYNSTDSTEACYIDFDGYLMLATRNKTSGKLSVTLSDLLVDRESLSDIDFLKEDVAAFFAASQSARGNRQP